MICHNENQKCIIKEIRTVVTFRRTEKGCLGGGIKGTSGVTSRVFFLDTGCNQEIQLALMKLPTSFTLEHSIYPKLVLKLCCCCDCWRQTFKRLTSLLRETTYALLTGLDQVPVEQDGMKQAAPCCVFLLSCSLSLPLHHIQMQHTAPTKYTWHTAPTRYTRHTARPRDMWHTAPTRYTRHMARPRYTWQLAPTRQSPLILDCQPPES